MLAVNWFPGRDGKRWDQGAHGPAGCATTTLSGTCAVAALILLLHRRANPHRLARAVAQTVQPVAVTVWLRR